MRGRLILLSAAVISLVAVTLLVPSLTLAKELAYSRALSGAQRLANELTPVVATGGDARPAVVDVNAEGGDQVRVLLPDGSQIGHGRSDVPARTLDRARREGKAMEVRTGEGGVLLQPVPRGSQGTAIVEVTFRNGDLTRAVAVAWTALGVIAAATIALGVMLTDRFAGHFLRSRNRPAPSGPPDPPVPAEPSAPAGASAPYRPLTTPAASTHLGLSVPQVPPSPSAPHGRPVAHTARGPVSHRAPRGRRGAGGAGRRGWRQAVPRRYRYALAWAGVVACALAVAAQAITGSTGRGTHTGNGSAGAAGAITLPPAPPNPAGSPDGSASPSPTPGKSKQTKPPRRAPGTASPTDASETPSRTPSRKPGRAAPRVTIDSPPQGTEVHGQAGVTLTGRATGLGGHRLRIIELAPDGLYYVADEGPVPVRSGRWSFHNGTIGAGAQDVGKTFTTIAVIANAACQRTLTSAVPNAEGNVVYRTLPPGCRAGDSVRVLKVAP